MEDKKLYQTKTFWTGVAAVVTAAAGFFSGGMDTGSAIQTAVTGLTSIFIRSGMLKK